MACQLHDQSQRSLHATAIRIFDLPIIDQTVTSFNKMVDLNSWQQPPAIGHLTDLDIKQSRVKPFKLDHPCHNQSVERHVKLVTAS